MKQFFSLFLLVLALLTGNVQAQTCCIPEGADFKLLAMNADFKAAHLAPEPLNYTPQAGSMITFKTLDGKDGKAFYVPSDQPTNKVLLIFHEWWGLNDYIKREAERWQALLGNVDIYAVDLYDGKVAATSEEAGKLSGGLDQKRGENIVKGLLSTVGKDKMIATLGWCMGGTWSFKATMLAEKRAAGCVMYYGFPEKEEKKIKGLSADVLYVWASRDKFITRDVVEAFGRQVTANGKAVYDIHFRCRPCVCEPEQS
ncbi:MAG: dienelactone hydrolase family protein [Sphingobacteriales bacterium]|nr:MAG: dienelactone hydrolase family protein [Sphingobacteriales bacterium]